MAYFRKRSLFRNFTESCLQDYVVYGTVAIRNGIRLKFDPKIETAIYRTLPHNYLDYKHRLKVPALSVTGETSTVIKAMDRRSMERNFSMVNKTVPGGHLFSFECPLVAAEVVKTWMRDETRSNNGKNMA